MAQRAPGFRAPTRMNGTTKQVTLTDGPGERARTGPRLAWLPALAWILLCAYVYRQALGSLIDLRDDDTVSYVFLVPLISGWLVYIDRKKLVTRHFEPLLSIPFFLLALAAAFFSSHSLTSQSGSSLSLLVLSLVLFLEAGFVALLGRTLARELGFALGFLFFAVPLPPLLSSRLIHALQSASAAVAELLFNGSGVPVLREGFVFHLSHVNIEVARECSGIRSSLALFLLAVLIARFAFVPFWKKAAFLAAGLSMMVLKNGVRIVTLTLLANYVDPGFLYGRLHHEGGVVFFLLGLLFLLPVYHLLRRGEPREERPR